MLDRSGVAGAFAQVGIGAPAAEEPPPLTEIPEYAEGTAEPGPAIIAARRFVPLAIDDVIVSTEPPWLIDGLLPARGLACIVGPPKSGKSFLTSDMLCSVARGAPYAGRETMQGAVIYLTGEGVSGFKRRLVA